MKYLAKQIGKFVPLFAMLTCLSHANAADIDIYSGVSGTAGSPNVLFFIDNTSNWSSAAQAWKKTTVRAKCGTSYSGADITTCQTYVDAVFGTDATLVQGQVELRALKLVLNKLVCESGAKVKVNAGIMFFSDGHVDAPKGSTGYIRHRIAPLDTTQCKVLLDDLDSISADITGAATKAPSAAAYGTALFEAFKYFGGWTNPAGALTATPGTPVSATAFGTTRYSLPNAYEDPGAFTDASKTTYKSPSDSVCGNNYIVLIGNTWPNQEYNVNQNASPYPTDPQMTRLGYNPGAQIYPVPLPNSEKSNVRFADEWAKFLYDTDVSDAAGVQNIRMFTVDVYNASADEKQGALLKSMAAQSSKDGSGYFKVGGDLKAMIDAFTDILTQVAAVDSVFASASLPVSVNAQGTYLNQVFMGVFRPDGAAQQRWTGNLKQYKFKLSGGALSLVDADGKSAVDAVNSGFIQHCARSFWTTGSDDYWKTITGMDTESACDPKNNKTPYSDSPDGPLVERGGAGQRLRNLGYAARNIRVCNDPTNCTATVDFDVSKTLGANIDLAAWVRGQNKGDGNIKASDGTVTYEKYGLADTATRPTIHGEVVHSRPLAINYGTGGDNDVYVFYGAGDGMLRAINGNQEGATLGDEGKEVWAFMAPEHYSTIERVRTNRPLIAFPNVKADLFPTPTPKTYFFDGSIGGYQERSASEIKKIWIYATMRRGGRSVYAFDVTGKPDITQPALLWRYGADEPRMGESWSTPTVIRIEGMSKPLVVFGAGYDPCEDIETSTSCDLITRGKGIVIADAEKGSANNYRFIGVASGELDDTAGRFVADVTAVDVNQDGYTDVLYAADTRGNIWRINTSDPAKGFTGISDVKLWPVNKIASVSKWTVESERRKFMYSPSAVVLGTQVMVLIGTGDREKPSAGSYAAKVNNRFYGIRDDVTKTKEVGVTEGFGVLTDVIKENLRDLKNVTSGTTYDASALSEFKGWFLNFTNTAPNEQVVTTPLTFAGVTYFSTYQAKDSNSNICKNLGTGRSYQVSFQTGTKPAGVDNVSTPFITEGIPPSPVGGLVEVGGVTVPFVIGGPGPTPLSPVKIVPKVRADRKPVYRYQKIDQ